MKIKSKILISLVVLVSNVVEAKQPKFYCARVFSSAYSEDVDFSYQDYDLYVKRVEEGMARAHTDSEINYISQRLALNGISHDIENSGIISNHSRIVISPQGDHIFNRIALRIFEINKGKIIYDPVALGDDAQGAYSSNHNEIYVSRRSVYDGKLDTTFFHEVRHWALFWRASQGRSSDTDGYFVRLFHKSPSLSAYEKYMSMQEVSTFRYHTDLMVSEMLKEGRVLTSSEIFQLRSRIESAMNVFMDARSYLNLIERQLAAKKGLFEVIKDNGNGIATFSFIGFAGMMQLPISPEVAKSIKWGKKGKLEKEFARQVATTRLRELQNLYREYIMSFKKAHIELGDFFKVEPTVAEHQEILKKTRAHLRK